MQKDTIISEFVSGMSLSDIGRKYNRTSERIWQIIGMGCVENEYKQYSQQNKINRKAIKLSKFIAFAVELGRVPRLNEAKSFALQGNSNAL